MATATEPKQADTDGYVDFDEFIDYQITKTRSGIKATDLLTALIGGAAAVLAYVLIFALFDHWIIEGGFAHSTRIGLLSLLVAGLVGWSVWKLVLPYFRKVTPLYAATQIEQTQPDLQNSLLTLVDLKNSGRPVPALIESALEKRSAVNLSHMDIDQAVDRRLLMRLSYVLFAMVVLMCAYVILSPKRLSNSLWRALLPTSNVAVATRTRIDDVEPGDVHVLARFQLEVTADLSGEQPAAVTLLYSTADRRFVDEPVTMRVSEEGLRRYKGRITGENGRGILQNLTYRVTAGDAESRSFTVSVKQPPSATVSEVEYEYPDYMSLSRRTQSGGSIDSWEGTWVTVRATANMPVTSALVMFSDTEDTSQRAEEIPATIQSETQITARWRLRIRSDGTYAGFYRLQCRNEAHETDPDPTLYSIKIRPDQPPEIQLVQPSTDLERPANAVVPLLFAAEDPDFLLRSVILHLEVNGDPLPQQPRLYQAPPFRKSLHDVHQLELAPLGLQPGDRLAYWLEARDNMEPFADRSGNRANTPKLNITITEPASPEEVQEQLEEDQQQIAEKLDDAQQQQNEDPAQPRPDESTDEDTSPPPPNAKDQLQPGEEPSPDPSDDPSQQQTGESGESGEAGGGQQRQPSSTGGESDEPSADGRGEETSPESPPQPGGESESNEEPTGEESFDDLLKKLMQREQEKQRQEGVQQQQTSRQPGEQPQPSPEPGQQPEGQQSGNSGQTGAESGSQSGDGEAGSNSDQQGTSGKPSPSSPGDPSTRSPSPMNNGSEPGAGDPSEPTSPSGAENQNTATSEAGPNEGGQPTSDDSAAPPSADSPTNDGTVEGGTKQPGTDPTGAKPGAEGGTDPVQPKPTGPEGSEPPLSDQPGPQPGDPLPNPDARQGGQPDGPDEPLQGEGDPEGQKSDRPQTGEGGNSQQTSQGNRGGDQQGAGDPTGRSGDQQPSGQKTGQPGSQQPGKGSQQQPGGSESGSEGSKSDGEGQSPTGGDSPSGDQGTGGEGQSPGGSPDGGGGPQEMPTQESVPKPSGESADQSPEQGGNEGPDQQAGGGEKGGQQDGGQKSGGESAQQSEASGGSQGQGGEPSQGGEPGSSQGPGSPSGQPGGEPAQGSQDSDASMPGGAGGGGQGIPGELSEAAAGENSGSNIKSEDPDLAAKKKAANLVLERLQDQLQRGEIDPELQQDLGLTPERLREFTDRLQQRLAETAGEDVSPEAQARRRQFEETLRTIDYDSKGTTREGGDGPREAASGFAGPNRPAPPQHRDAVRLYREQLLKKRRSGR